MRHSVVSLKTAVCSGALASALWSWQAISAADNQAKIEGKNIRLEFDQPDVQPRDCPVRWQGNDHWAIFGFGDPDGRWSRGIRFRAPKRNQTECRDEIGAGKQTTLTGTAGPLQKTVIVTTYDRFPGDGVLQGPVHEPGQGRYAGSPDGRTTTIRLPRAQDGSSPAFWSYESGSYQRRPDWVMPLKAGFKQENYLGMNATDYGGGTPVVDVWRRDVGIGIGHVELTAKLVSMPVEMPDAEHATLALSFHPNEALHPGGSIETFRSFASVHQGDYFRTLRAYSDVMQAQGVHLAAAPDSAFEPIWCAWGYGRTFTPSQVLGALPVVKKLGFSWVGVDDGWQSSDGDWGLVKTKFPNGDADMQALVDQIHKQGFRAQLWWAPLTAKPDSEIATNHPEYLLLNADGSKQKISYWNDWYLCPSNAAVIEHHRQLVIKMFRDWHFRRTQAGRSTYERRAALLQSGPPSQAA